MRLVNRSTGLPARPLDAVAVAGLSIWAAISLEQHLILLLAAASIYYWGSYRARQPANRHAALDLQAIGYLCFALAAWNSCGFGSVPSFALFPEKMIELGTRDFAVGQLKSIMAFFVLGWLFTTLGFFKAARAARRDG